MELCSDEDTTDCCRTGRLNAAFTDDWSAGDFEEWSGGYLGRCEDKELGVRGGPRVRLSKASQVCFPCCSVQWTVKAGEERLEVVELAVHAVEEECATIMFGLVEVCHLHTTTSYVVPHQISCKTVWEEVFHCGSFSLGQQALGAAGGPLHWSRSLVT